MPIPGTKQELQAAGYRFLDHGCCDACEQRIEWWRTPQGRQIPFDPMPAPEAPACGHWSTCNQLAHAARKAGRAAK